ncbi:MAG: hypothetical protein L7F78_22140 [Syntrophales bacterium LBB04]|nr:hypothetical protein [Syntrophales bacterium LBB04]
MKAHLELQKEISELITQFTAAVQNAGMYPSDHPQVISLISDSHHLLSELLKARHEITILLIGRNIMIDNKPLLIASIHENAFVRILKKHSIERITFTRGLSVAHLGELIRSMASSVRVSNWS